MKADGGRERGQVRGHVRAGRAGRAPVVRRVLNPCCGVGTFVAMANALGLGAVGVEESASRCAEARALRLSRAAVEQYRVETGTLPPSSSMVKLLPRPSPSPPSGVEVGGP